MWSLSHWRVWETIPPSPWWCVTAAVELPTSFPSHTGSQRKEGELWDDFSLTVLGCRSSGQKKKADLSSLNLLFPARLMMMSESNFWSLFRRLSIIAKASRSRSWSWLWSAWRKGNWWVGEYTDKHNVDIFTIFHEYYFKITCLCEKINKYLSCEASGLHHHSSTPLIRVFSINILNKHNPHSVLVISPWSCVICSCNLGHSQLHYIINPHV